MLMAIGKNFMNIDHTSDTWVKMTDTSHSWTHLVRVPETSRLYIKTLSQYEAAYFSPNQNEIHKHWYDPHKCYIVFGQSRERASLRSCPTKFKVT